MNTHNAELTVIAEDEAAATALASAVFELRPRRLTLRCADPDKLGLAAINAFAVNSGYRIDLGPAARRPYIEIGEWEEYESHLPKMLRGDTRRRRRRLAEQGEVSVEVVDGSERLGPLLREGFTVEAAGWKGRAGTAITSRPKTREFFIDGARWAASRGILRLAFLRLDGRPIAFQYDLEDNGVFFFLKTGFDPAFSVFAPGRLLLHEMVRRAFALGLKRFELLGGDDPYKLQWTSTCHELVRLHAFAPTIAGRVEGAAYVYGSPLAKRTLALTRKQALALKRG
jgi:CelD/BcsL family acetyltransferase involved in cellulose biosynthesis